MDDNSSLLSSCNISERVRVNIVLIIFDIMFEIIFDKFSNVSQVDKLYTSKSLVIDV